MNVWTYVIKVNSGGAPNFEGPFTTLTICKPRICRAAQRGDLVLAFNGKPLNPTEPHSVRWAGIVSEVISLKDYWIDPRFQGKKPGRPRGPHESPDNIYKPNSTGGLDQVENETHQPSHMERDVSGVNALVFSPSWYFGPAVVVLPEQFNLRMIGGRIGQRRFIIDDDTQKKLIEWLDQRDPTIPSEDRATEGKIRCVSGKDSGRTGVRPRC